MEKIVIDLLKRLKIPISLKYCRFLLLAHPNYPSLLSISDAFDKLDINYSISRITKDELADVPLPCILLLQQGKGVLKIIDSLEGLAHIDLTSWDGIVLQVSKEYNGRDALSKAEYFYEKRSKTILLILMVSVGLIFAAVANDIRSLPLAGLILLSVVGTAVSFLIILKDMGLKSKALEAVCNSDTNSDCDKVLNSKGASLFKGFKLSDISISYFIFQGLLLMISVYSPSFIEILTLGSIMAILISIASIWYQVFVVKSWCRLCMFINCVLFIQAPLFAVLAYSSAAFLPLDYINVGITTLIFFIVISLVLLFKGTYEENLNTFNSLVDAYRIKNDPNVFIHLLSRERSINISSYDDEILLGATDAPIKIVMVTNLHCGHCKEKFEMVRDLVTKHPDKILVTVRLMRPGKELEAVPCILKLFKKAVLMNSDNQAKMKVLSDWFDVLDLPKYLKLNSLDEGVEMNEQYNLADNIYEWMMREGILSSPTFIVNGKLLPRNYSFKDLCVLVPSLYEIVPAFSQSFEVKFENG